VQAVIQDVANDYRDVLALETDRVSSAAREEFVAQGGVVVPVAQDKRRLWAANLPDLAGEWVKVMEEAGLPGREILADYMQIMRDNDQPIMRQWGQE
jgi:hypothetical protein